MKNLKIVTLGVGALMFLITVLKIIFENSNQWLGLVGGHICYGYTLILIKSKIKKSSKSINLLF